MIILRTILFSDTDLQTVKTHVLGKYKNKLNLYCASFQRRAFYATASLGEIKEALSLTGFYQAEDNIIQEAIAVCRSEGFFERGTQEFIQRNLSPAIASPALLKNVEKMLRYINGKIPKITEINDVLIKISNFLRMAQSPYPFKQKIFLHSLAGELFQIFNHSLMEEIYKNCFFRVVLGISTEVKPAYSYCLSASAIVEGVFEALKVLLMTMPMTRKLTLFSFLPSAYAEQHQQMQTTLTGLEIFFSDKDSLSIGNALFEKEFNDYCLAIFESSGRSADLLRGFIQTQQIIVPKEDDLHLAAASLVAGSTS